MVRCASSWPRRGSCRLNFAHVFRILFDLSILLWVGVLGLRPSQRPCTFNRRIFLKVLRAVRQPSWNRVVGVGSCLISGRSHDLRGLLLGSPTVLWVEKEIRQEWPVSQAYLVLLLAVWLFLHYPWGSLSMTDPYRAEDTGIWTLGSKHCWPWLDTILTSEKNYALGYLLFYWCFSPKEVTSVF